MSEKKGWGSTVAGWFIEREEPSGSVESADTIDSPAASEEALASSPEDYASPSPTQGVFKTSPPPPAGGQVDFGAVFGAA